MKFKSKSLISIILSIMMVMSMILVAIPANAAVVDSEPVGADTTSYYLWYTIGDNTNYSSFTKKVEMTADGSNYVASFEASSITTYTKFVCYINTDSSNISTGLNITLNKDTKGTCDSSYFSWINVGDNFQQDGFFYIKSEIKSDLKIKVTYNPTANTIDLSKDDGTTPIETTTQPATQPATETTAPATGEWFLIGGGGPGDNIFGEYSTTNTAYQLTGTGTILSRSVTFASGKTYFRFHDKTSQYSLSTTSEEEIGDANNKKQLLVSSGKALIFNNNTGSNQTVNICLDTSNNQVWYESATDPTDPTEPTEPTTTPVTTSGKFKIVDKTDANGKLTFSAPDKAAGTADAGNTVTITGTPLNSYYELSNVSVSYKVGKTEVPLVASKTDGKFTFDIPSDLDYTTVKDATISVKGTFTLTSTGKLDYVIAQGAGLYIDVAPTKEDTTATLIKWNNYQGPNHGTSNPYTFYVPKNVDLANAVIYNTTENSVTIGGQTINNNDKAEGVKLTKGNNTITNCSITDKVVVMQGSTDAMFLNTTKEDGTDFDLPTARKWQGDNGITDKQASEYKATIKSSGGSCTTMDNTSGTAKFSSAMGLDTVKGRGNSSWKASATMFGKYAFNMKLSSPTSLFDLPKSKSFCLLANNADDAMMRNAYVYQLAKDIGLYDSPEFEFVDIYDNGEYMGAYLITEKVDVADKNKLIKGNSIDDLNEKAGAKFDETNHRQGYASYASDNTVDLDNDTEFVKKYQTTGTYLLEFEIDERYLDEISWFISTEGQHVVVKNPEFATKGEVEFIKKKFNEMEALVYASTIDLEALSKVMDLDSFARMYLIQEFSANLDSAATSFYITYDCSNGLFVASPVWDYDWALGQNNGSKKSKSGSDLYSKDATQWFARDKAMGKGDATGKYSLQSKLATDSNFKTVIKKVWNGKNNDGFYAKVQEYYKTGGYLDTWKNQISKSVNMNETRWGFIANNPLRSGAWGEASTNTTNFNGKTGFEGAVEFLKGTNNAGWSKNRVDNLLNSGINAYGAYTQIATPTLTAYASDGTTPLEGEVTAGDTYVIKAETSEIYVDYVLYDGSTKVDENSNGVFKISNATSGTHSYTVKTVYKSTNEKTSSAVEVTVNASSDVKNITVYFKTATAPAYAPSVSFDGGDATAMTKSSELGKDYSGALTFAWYSVTINDVDTTKTHALTFTSKRTKLNAAWSGKLTTDNYFTADNLMRDTVAVDLTGKGDIEKNFFYSATNMVYDSTDAKNKTLGFTYYGGARVKMGSVVNELDGTVSVLSEPNVKSATYIQMLNASLITVSSLQSELYDVNFDGKVDVKDATYIQYALAS